MALFKAVKDSPSKRSEFVFDYLLPPVVKQQGRRLEQDTVNLASNWRPHEDFSIELLESVSRYLARLNRYPLKRKEREELLDFAAQNCSSAINKLYAKYQHDNGVPELEDRRTALITAMDAAERMLLGHLRLLKDYEQLNPREFEKQQQQISIVVARVFEWLFVIQRLAALRYQKLASKYWKLTNQLFFQVYSELDVELELPLVGCVWGWLRTTGGARLHYQDGRQCASIQELYISIQLFGVMDVITWPCHQSHVLDGYLPRLQPALTITRDEGQSLSGTCLILHYSGDSPPGFRRNNQQEKVLFVELSALQSSLQNTQLLLEANDRLVADLFLKLDKPDRLPLVELMLSKLGDRHRQDERFRLNANVSLSLYCGFMECFNLIHERGRGGEKKGQLLRDTLAQHSSILEGRGGRPSAWFVKDESAGGIQLRINENRYIHPVYVGQLIAYTLRLGDQQEAPQLGYIYRLFRPKDGVLEVTVVKLSIHTEGVALQSPLMKERQRATPAILVRANKEEKWQVVLPQRHPFEKGDNLYLRREGKSYPIVFPKASMVQREFNIYTIKGSES